MSEPGVIGGRDHFNDFDLDSPEFNEHYDEVLDTLLEQWARTARQARGASRGLGHGLGVADRLPQGA